MTMTAIQISKLETSTSPKNIPSAEEIVENHLCLFEMLMIKEKGFSRCPGLMHLYSKLLEFYDDMCKNKNDKVLLIGEQILRLYRTNEVMDFPGIRDDVKQYLFQIKSHAFQRDLEVEIFKIRQYEKNHQYQLMKTCLYRTYEAFIHGPHNFLESSEISDQLIALGQSVKNAARKNYLLLDAQIMQIYTELATRLKSVTKVYDVEEIELILEYLRKLLHQILPGTIEHQKVKNLLKKGERGLDWHLMGYKMRNLVENFSCIGTLLFFSQGIPVILRSELLIICWLLSTCILKMAGYIFEKKQMMFIRKNPHLKIRPYY